ncbi:methyltransferase family protein [Acidovorax facilis]|nr:hypothetical protein AE621_04650 [Acidovorax sp. SD340]
MKPLLLPPVVWLVSVVCMLVLHWKSPIAVWLPQPYNWLGLALIMAGLGIANWHARLFRRLGTNINTFGEPGELTMEGLFRRTRNPMYLGMFISLFGVACVLGSTSALAGPVAFFALAQFWYIRSEEEAMTLKFGDKYIEYQRSVPRWL